MDIWQRYHSKGRYTDCGSGKELNNSLEFTHRHFCAFCCYTLGYFNVTKRKTSMLPRNLGVTPFYILPCNSLNISCYFFLLNAQNICIKLMCHCIKRWHISSMGFLTYNNSLLNTLPEEEENTVCLHIQTCIQNTHSITLLITNPVHISHCKIGNYWKAT
jgi:hypothetical protein